MLSESTESLQRRFRRVEISLNQPIENPPAVPAEWLLSQAQARRICFYDSQYREGESEKQYQKHFSNSSNIALTALSLRDIFIVYAKQYKISEFENLSKQEK